MVIKKKGLESIIKVVNVYLRVDSIKELIIKLL